MASESDKYYLDGLDLYDTFGIIVEYCSADFMIYPKLSEPLSHIWDDGIQYDLSNPQYEPRIGTIRFSFVSNNGSTFWNRYIDFWNKLSGPNLKQLEIVDLGQVFSIFYRENPSVKKLTSLRKDLPGKKAAKYEIKVEISKGGFLDSGLGSYYYGPVSFFPTTWGQVLDMPKVQTEGRGSIVNINTGTTATKQVIVLRDDKEIDKAIDISASNSNLKTLYVQRGPLIENPDGVMYKVLGLSYLLPYDINHVHQITLKNKDNG